MSARNRLLSGLLVGLALLQTACSSSAAEEATVLPAPLHDQAPGTAHSQTAVFAGGCFWGVQGVFQHLKGVQNVVSGYAGGAANTAQYERVSAGGTGHAEAVQITYDPQQVSYGTLLQVFFSVAHNPTELNRQGPDTGTQYRSAVFPQTDEQRSLAQAYISQLENAHVFNAPIVTRLESTQAFYPAETYHQNFLTNHPTHPYIVINDLPKVHQLKQLFAERYNDDPVLVQTW